MASNLFFSPPTKSIVGLLPMINYKWHSENGSPAVSPVCASGSSLLQDKAMLNIKLNCIMCHIVAVTDVPSRILNPYWPDTNNQNRISASWPEMSKIIQCPTILSECIDWSVKSCSYWSHCNSENTERKCRGGFHWLIKNHSAKCIVRVYASVCVKAVSRALKHVTFGPDWKTIGKANLSQQNVGWIEINKNVKQSLIV